MQLTLATVDQLPALSRFRELCIAAATLDAIIMPDWQLRYFSFDSQWGSGEEMASCRNGSGSHHYCLFSEAGCFLKGFSPDSQLNLPSSRGDNQRDWHIENVPDALASCLAEPAFEMDDVSYCLWWLSKEPGWRHGSPPSPELLTAPLGYVHLLMDNPEAYALWATEYYEREVPIGAVADIQALRPLTAQLVGSLNGGVKLKSIAKELRRIGYPV
jgi:hypothetical protein